MKNPLSCILILCLVTSSCDLQLHAQLHSQRIITSDVAAFWKAYDLFWRDTTQNPFIYYLEEGSLGLKEFIPNRIKSAAALKARVLRERSYYEGVRSAADRINTIEQHVEKVFESLKKIYPAAIPCNVFFVIGRITSGGTATANGIIIGYETFSETETRTSSGRKSESLNRIPAIVAHELVHFQQNKEAGANTVLKLSILEGAADFVAERMGYADVKLLNGDSYSYGDQHEKELWKKFEMEKSSDDYKDWLYNQGSVKGIPNDLGYWMGYKICAAYYTDAIKKGKSIRDILLIKDYEAFLQASGYGKKNTP